MEPPHPLGRVKREPLGDFSGTKLRRSTISLSKQGPLFQDTRRDWSMTGRGLPRPAHMTNLCYP